MTASDRFLPCSEMTIYSLAIATAGNHRVKSKSGNRSTRSVRTTRALAHLWHPQPRRSCRFPRKAAGSVAVHQPGSTRRFTADRGLMPPVRSSPKRCASSLGRNPITVTLHGGRQLRSAVVSLVQGLGESIQVAGSQCDHLACREDLPGPFLGRSQQEAARRHPGGRGRPDVQLLDLRRQAQVNAFLGSGGSGHRNSIVYGKIRFHSDAPASRPSCGIDSHLKST